MEVRRVGGDKMVTTKGKAIERVLLNIQQNFGKKINFILFNEIVIKKIISTT